MQIQSSTTWIFCGFIDEEFLEPSEQTAGSNFELNKTMHSIRRCWNAETTMYKNIHVKSNPNNGTFMLPWGYFCSFLQRQYNSAPTQQGTQASCVVHWSVAAFVFQ
eukprot:m.183648 g.183648  ORF g.183648 m.183648 type:complete len:106 (+) comp18482_c0_seq4:1025-1342(+)